MKKRDDEQRPGELICCYPAAVKEGAIKAHIPLRHVRWVEQGVAEVAFSREQRQMRPRPGMPPTAFHENRHV